MIRQLQDPSCYNSLDVAYNLMIHLGSTHYGSVHSHLLIRTSHGISGVEQNSRRLIVASLYKALGFITAQAAHRQH